MYNLELTNAVRRLEKEIRHEAIRHLLSTVTLNNLVSLKKIETIPSYLSKQLGVSLSCIHNDLLEINQYDSKRN